MDLVETKNDEEDIVEIQAAVDGAADDVIVMNFAIVGGVDGLPRTCIIAAPFVVVEERKLTVTSYEINYVAAMTKPAFALAKKRRREATFVKDRGKPRVAFRHCRQLGCRAMSKHERYNEQNSQVETARKLGRGNWRCSGGTVGRHPWRGEAIWGCGKAKVLMTRRRMAAFGRVSTRAETGIGYRFFGHFFNRNRIFGF